ncbi:MAG: endonuclease [Microbacteriaceae bacterium]|nr:endonuclease [Microbacteriaceae bacterium]
MEMVARCSQLEAGRRIRMGEAIRVSTSLTGEPLLPQYPHVAAAMVAGSLGMDAASSIVRCLGQAADAAPPDALECAELALVGEAAYTTADLIAFQARVWREALDPDGVEQRGEALRRRRSFSVGREIGGMTPICGWADPVSAGLIRAMLSEGANPRSKPRFLSADDTALGTETTTLSDGRVVDILRDPRSREQRQFDVLIGTLTAGLRQSEMPGGTRSMTTVMAVVRLEDLRNGTGVGWIDDVDEPISAPTIQRLACDAGFRKILLGDHGEVLHLGTRERLFSAAQRKAVAVRDGGCVWENCTAPPGWCEAHHVVEYQNGGPTDIDNGTNRKYVPRCDPQPARLERAASLSQTGPGPVGGLRLGRSVHHSNPERLGQALSPTGCCCVPHTITSSTRPSSR